MAFKNSFRKNQNQLRTSLGNRSGRGDQVAYDGFIEVPQASQVHDEITDTVSQALRHGVSEKI